MRQRARRQRRAGARHHADQEDGRGPHRLPARAGSARALPALQHRHDPAHRDPPRRCASASSTCSSASTCSARVSTCPRCRWCASSTPTRRASCARETSLIQTIGRAARNVDGQVVMYADRMTDSMERAIGETNSRRAPADRLQRRARDRPADHPQGGRRHPVVAAARRHGARARQGQAPPARARQGAARAQVVAAAGAGAARSRPSRRRCTRRRRR